MNHDVLRKFRLQNLVPTNHLLAILLKDLQEARVEVSLQRVVVFDSFLFHKSLNGRVSVPLFPFILVAADVHVCVGKQSCHFTKKGVEKLVDLFARGIESRLKYSRAALNRIWTRRTAEFRMANKPTRAVAGYVKLRNDANTTIASVSDNFFYLVLCVVVAV